jgi:hypothetical protein
VITSTSVVTVVKASPVITPTLTIGSSGAGLSVSVSATGIPSPGGSVSVSELGQQLSRANVIGGVAEVGLPITLTSGAHTFTVTYSGFGNVDVGSTTVTVSLP